MFTAEERTRLRFQLLKQASADPRIGGAAITGSAAEDREDRLSDVDLAFGVTVGAEVQRVLTDWTTHMYDQHAAVHHVDVKSGAWIYRVFLLHNSLQVDLAFVPASEFRALAPAFRLMHGTASEPRHIPPPLASDIIGMGWLFALHARSSIARRKLWQAEYMISGVRDHALALSCLRHALPAANARGIDQLPSAVTAPFEGALVRHLDVSELKRAFGVALKELVKEIKCADENLAERLQGPLSLLSETYDETSRRSPGSKNHPKHVARVIRAAKSDRNSRNSA
jgi:hypothetical protein